MGNAQTRSKPRYEGLKVSREEYLSLEDDGFKYDMIGGILHVSPSHSHEHGRTQTRFGHYLHSLLDQTELGEATVEVDLFLPDGGDKLRPDLSFVLKENLSIIQTHIHGNPDLICEVLSDSTAARDLGEKADRYLNNGVKEYWIADPRDRSIQLWINRESFWEKRSGNVLASELLPGFEVETRRLYG